MINARQLTDEVIIPCLRYLGYHSEDAVDLILGTAAHESHLGHYLRQVKGPALGLYQVEPATHSSIWDNYLRYRPELAEKVRQLASVRSINNGIPDHSELIYNLFYSTAICRLVYLPARPPIPSTVQGRAEYWKAYYNSSQGRGTVEKYLDDYRRLVEGGR
jgi:hypothetical protein